MWSRWWIVVPVACLTVVAVAQDHLSEFLQVGRGESPQERVGRMRDGLLARLRCGSQQGLTEKLCRECLSTERIVNMTRGDSSRASVVFLNYLLTFRTSCTPESVKSGHVGDCGAYEGCGAELRGRLASPGSLEAVEKILREVKAVFEPDPTKPCFSAEMVLSELDTASKPLDTLPRDIATILLLTSHFYSGECIDVGESVADFLDDIFLHYGDGCERIMTQSGFTKLWNDLQMQRRGKHVDHGVQKNSCKPEWPSSRTADEASSTESQMNTANDDMATTRAEVIRFDTTPSHAGRDMSSVPVRTTADAADVENSTTLVVLIPHSEPSRVPADSDLYLLGEEGTHAASANGRRARHTPFPEDHEHKNLANECLPSDDLLQRFLSPGNQVITSSEFLQLCPALVQQAVSGVCSARLKAVAVDPNPGNETRGVQLQLPSQSANGWWAVASVSVITAISLLGLFLLPVLKKSFFVHINAFFTGLAFGTMSGDVVLHIMPQYLNLHRHDDTDHDHDTESAVDRLFPSHLQRQLAFLLTMYLLFLLECLFTALTQGPKEHHSGHSHGPVEINLRDLTAAGDVEDGAAKSDKLPRCSRIVEFLKPSNLFSGISSKAAVIVLADTVHNFADGMAIAVGFSTSYKDGFSTSVAVFFHELPHEIGDFAVLMNCGLGYWRAFAFNVLSGLTAFLGLGVGVFTASLFREWLLCVTAGLFFFVVMAEMLPDMRLESKEKWREFAVKVIGTMCGIATMICIAMYELSST